MFLRKTGGAKKWTAFLLFDLLFLPLAFLRESFRGRGRSVLAKAWGVWDGLRGRRVKKWIPEGERFSRKKVAFY